MLYEPAYRDRILCRHGGSYRAGKTPQMSKSVVVWWRAHLMVCALDGVEDFVGVRARLIQPSRRLRQWCTHNCS
jgi:hypothetical protein